MAYLCTKLSSLIILLFYSNVFNSANIVTANDSWLWPDKVDSVIDESSITGTDKVVSSSTFDDGLAISQRRQTISYKSYLPFIGTGGQTNKGNLYAWKKLKINSVRPTLKGGYFGFSRNPNSEIEKNKNFTSNESNEQQSDVNWNLPDDPPKRKSESKCAEYNKAIEDAGVWIHPLVGNWPTSASAQIRVPTKCKGLQNPLIVGGIVAKPGEFPHMAALGWPSQNNKTSFLCGGSLISNRWVLTAAHCTHGTLGPPKVVRIGAGRLSDKTVGQLLQVLQIIRHPSYKPPAVYADLALIKLDETVNFGVQIRPACLHSEFDTSPLQAWATGWGVTAIGEEQSDELLKVRLDVISNVGCAMKLNRSVAIPRGIVPNMLCAGDMSGDWQSDTCQGDSGGPLQTSHPTYKCLYQILGVTSFGRLCAIQNSPGVYTRVSHYLDWIEANVWPDNH